MNSGYKVMESRKKEKSCQIGGYYRMRMLRSLFASVLLLLSGCALGPDGTAPDLALPQAFQQSLPQAPVWPDRGWWKGFGSDDLDRLIADAESANFDIQAAVARIRQADAQVQSSGAGLLPSLSGTDKNSWQRSYQRVSNSRLTGLRSGYAEARMPALQLNVSYEVDVWGRVAATREAAIASALASRYDQQTVALTAVSSVATTWFTALAYLDRLQVALRNLNDSEQILAAVRARAEAGTASELDVAQQGALVAGIRAQIPGLRSNAQQQLNALGLLTGRAPENIRVAPGTLNTLSLPAVAPGLPSDLLLRRPDVATAEAQLKAANANIRVARANFYPQITLTGAGGWESGSLATLFGPTAVIASFASSVTQTVFDNGAKAASFKQNEARYDELLANYRKTVVQAFTDVENALTQWRYTTEQEKLYIDAVAVAQRAADIARAQVLAGTSDIVTALQAQNTLFSNLDTLAQVRLQRFLALVALYKAMGGGWQITDTEPPAAALLSNPFPADAILPRSPKVR
jgi:NodT family efflux transporter outer membrane factor (OMF) lipoprotein